MISTRVLTPIAIGEAVIVVVLLAVVFGHGVWLAVDGRRSRPWLARGRRVLSRSLDDAAAASAAVEHLSQMPTRLQRRLLAEMAPSVLGRQRQRLTRIASDLGLLDGARKRVTRRRWSTRLRGAWELATFGDERPTMIRLLDDRDHRVRTIAAEWAGDNADGAVTQRLITMLEHDPSPLCRATAKDALLRAGPVSHDAIAAALASGVAGAGLVEVAIWRPTAEYLEGGLRLANHPVAAVRAGAAALLGALGGEGATDALVARLGDEDSQVRAAAAGGLGRLGHWPAGADVVPLLRDRSFDVRRAAGEALAGMGAPGLLLLRRALNDTDAFAADMARRVLEVAELERGTAA